MLQPPPPPWPSPPPRKAAASLDDAAPKNERTKERKFEIYLVWNLLRIPLSIMTLDKNMAISISYLSKGFIKMRGQANFFQNFKRPKSREDGSDFDDFWTNRIVTVSAKF